MKMFFKSRVASIYYDEQNKILVNVYSGFAKTNEWTELSQKGLEGIKAFGVKKWISDMTDMKILSPENQKYANEVFVPEALRIGIKRVATVVSKDIFNKFAVEAIMSRIEAHDFTSRYFSTMEDAVQWLQNEKV